METTEKMLKLAESYNYFTFDNIPQKVLSDKWFSERIDWKREQFDKMQIPEGLAKIQGIKVCIFAKISEQFTNVEKEHELYYIDNFYICIYSEKSNSLLQLMCNKDKYYLHPIYDIVNRLQMNTEYRQCEPFIKAIPEPNLIGVFTEKKVNDWIIYCNEYVAALVACSDFVNDKKATNEAKVQATIEALKGCKVKKYNNTTYIETGLFNIVFELLDSGTYLSQKITYNGGLDGIIRYNEAMRLCRIGRMLNI